MVYSLFNKIRDNIKKLEINQLESELNELDLI